MEEDMDSGEEDMESSMAVSFSSAFSVVDSSNGGDHGPAAEQEEEVPAVRVAVKGRVRTKAQYLKDVDVEVTDEDVTFSDMQLSEELLKGLKLCRYEKPTPIQLKAIPLGGQMNCDLLLQAKNGTGKTCVFTVCILQQMRVSDLCIQAIVVAPSREVAVQISDVTKSIGVYMNGLKVKEFIGGTSISQAIRRLKNCHVAVGTPGRLTHMIREFGMDLSKVSVIALDEADKLMDQSFYEDIQCIFKTLPKRTQFIATSATYPENVLQFLENFMKSPCKIQLDLDNPTLCAVEQYMVDVKKIIGKPYTSGEDNAARADCVRTQAFNLKWKCLKEIMRRLTYRQAIIFSNYQLRAQEIHELFEELGWDVDLLSGGRSQEDRLRAFRKLQEGVIKVLVATDVGSRGIDVMGLDLVINFDIPKDKETYLHRVGRTGRFGSSGRVFSLCYFEAEARTLIDFQSDVHFTLRAISELDDINKLNENVKLPEVPGTSAVDIDSTTEANWFQAKENVFALGSDNECIEHHIVGDEHYRPTISYHEVETDIENALQKSEKGREKKKQRRLLLENGANPESEDEGDDEESSGGEDFVLSSDMEEDDDEEEEEEDGDGEHSGGFTRRGRDTKLETASSRLTEID